MTGDTDRHSACLTIAKRSTNSDAKYSEKVTSRPENRGSKGSGDDRVMLFSQARCVRQTSRATLTRSGAESRLESEAYPYELLSSSSTTRARRRSPAR